MIECPLYLDEDTSSARLLEALGARSVDVISAFAAGLNGRSDEDQLLWATKAGRVIYTFNAGHFAAYIAIFSNPAVRMRKLSWASNSAFRLANSFGESYGF